MSWDDEVVTEAALRKSQVMSEFKIAEKDAAVMEMWLLEDMLTLASLPGTLEEVLKNTNMVKSAASKFLSWLLPGQTVGERYFPDVSQGGHPLVHSHLRSHSQHQGHRGAPPPGHH